MADWTPPIPPDKSPSWTPPISPDSASTGPSVGERISVGMADPAVGGAQLAVHIGAVDPEAAAFVPPDIGKQASPLVDKAIQEREQAYQQRRSAAGQTGTDWWRLAGNVVSPVNLAVGAGLGAGAPEAILARLAMGGVGGAIGGATEPVTSGDYWHEKTKQTLEGTAGGAATAGALGAAGKVMAPQMTKAAQVLADKGVQLTPGMMMGNAARRIEEAGLKNFPILSYFVRGAEQRSIESFDRATINQALEPISKTLPKTAELGYKAVDKAADLVSDAYNKVYGTVSLAHSPELDQALGQIRTNAQTMVPERQKQLDGILNEYITSRFDANGQLPGKALKEAETNLRVEATRYKRSPYPDEQKLGYALDQTRSVLRNEVGRQFPDEEAAMRRADAAYAMLVRVEDATSRRLGSGGVFTPMDLLSASRSDAPRIAGRAREFAHGDSLFQNWAVTAQTLLPSKVAESGTAERLMLSDTMKGLIGAEAPSHIPGVGGYADPLTILGAGAVGSLPYTAAGQKATQALMSPAQWKNVTQDIMRRMGVAASPGAGAITGEMQ